MDNNSHLEHLFNDVEVYVFNSSEKEIKTTTEHQKTTPTPKENKTKKYDSKRVYVFVDYKINEEEKQYLSKVLNAVNINLKDCIIDEWNREAKPFDGKNFVFSQHISTCEISVARISAPALSLISQNVELRKSLWENMQKLFL